jgi:hypothetical protein
MVTVSIFALRDIIRRVQVSYKIPYNSISHTSPAANEDVQEIRDYLQKETLQAYTPNRKGNEHATPVHDLVSGGAAYANTAGAFNNFRRDTRNATNHGTAHSSTNTDDISQTIADEEADIDLGADTNLNVDDLTMDEEEFPVGTEIADFMSMTREFVCELSQSYE